MLHWFLGSFKHALQCGLNDGQKCISCGAATSVTFLILSPEISAMQKKTIFIEHKHEDCHSTTMKPPSIASNQTNVGRECSSFQGIFMSLLGES